MNTIDTEDRMDETDREIRALLKDYPMADAAAGFYDQALARATHEGTRRQRNRWLMAGFGSAVVAGMSKAGFAIGKSVPASTRLDAERRGLPTVLRIAPHYYNTNEEIERFVSQLKCLI